MPDAAEPDRGFLAPLALDFRASLRARSQRWQPSGLHPLRAPDRAAPLVAKPLFRPQAESDAMRLQLLAQARPDQWRMPANVDHHRLGNRRFCRQGVHHPGESAPGRKCPCRPTASKGCRGSSPHHSPWVHHTSGKPLRLMRMIPPSTRRPRPVTRCTRAKPPSVLSGPLYTCPHLL